MNKRDLVDAVAEATGKSKVDTSAAVDAVFDAITRAMAAREKVAIAHFGSFEAQYKGERDARNPQTGATVRVAARHVPRFKPASALKDAIK
jgi:DNA-binding protein HU-beta